MKARKEAVSRVCAAQRVGYAPGEADAVAGAGDENVITAARRQLPAQQVEAVVDVMVHYESASLAV